jgi:hypothetical protein
LKMVGTSYVYICWDLNSWAKVSLLLLYRSWPSCYNKLLEFQNLVNLLVWPWKLYGQVCLNVCWGLDS